MSAASFLEAHAWFTIFFGLLLEYLGLPIPGELILLFFGATVYWGKLSLWAVLVTGLVAVLLGDHFWYFAARRGGKKWLRFFCRATLGSAQCEARTERFFGRYGAASLLLAKFLPGLRTFATPMAGMSGVPYLRFFVYDSLGSLIWLVGTVQLGVLMATQFGAAVVRIHQLGGTLLVIFALSGLVVLAMRLRKRTRGGAPIMESEPRPR
jgi:membrane protein DedA with SNARE-associated domain